MYFVELLKASIFLYGLFLYLYMSVYNLMPQYIAFVFCIGMHSSATMYIFFFMFALLDIGALIGIKASQVGSNQILGASHTTKA